MLESPVGMSEECQNGRVENVREEWKGTKRRKGLVRNA